MENFEYSTSSETMFSDCSLLHKPDEEIFIKGKNLEKFFRARMKSMPKQEKILNGPRVGNSSNQAFQFTTDNTGTPAPETKKRKRPPKHTRDRERLEFANKMARVVNDVYCLLCQQEGHVMFTVCATCLTCGNKGHVRKDCQALQVFQSQGENTEQNGDGEIRDQNGYGKADRSNIKSEDENKEQNGHDKEDRAGDELGVNNDELKCEKDTEGSEMSDDKREDTGSEIKTEAGVTEKEKDKSRNSNPSNNATPAASRSSSPKDLYNEIDILHRQVADCVKKRLDMYTLGQAGTQPKNIKIKDVEQYTKLAKLFSHKMRAQIKETYEQDNRTLVGVAITADNKEQIKLEIDMYFDTQPVVE